MHIALGTILGPEPATEDRRSPWVPGSSREIFCRAARERRIAYHDAGLEFLVAYYKSTGTTPRACHPRDLLDQLGDHARFLGIRAALTPQLLDLVLQSYFIPTASGPPTTS